MTNLSRRRFFGLLGGTAATYFLAPIGGWKSDVIINPVEGFVMSPIIANSASLEAVKNAYRDVIWLCNPDMGYLYWSKKPDYQVFDGGKEMRVPFILQA